jgi:hypothetical protein
MGERARTRGVKRRQLWAVSLGSSEVTLDVSDGRLNAAFFAPPLLKLRCSGPEIGADLNSLASGSAPIAPLANGALTIKLRRGA